MKGHNTEYINAYLVFICLSVGSHVHMHIDTCKAILLVHVYIQCVDLNAYINKIEMLLCKGRQSGKEQFILIGHVKDAVYLSTGIW